MSKEIIANSLNRNFESLKKVDENGIEYWEARELMPILGYEKWQNAEEVIGRAAKASINSGQAVDNHFTVFSKMVELLDRAGTTELAANLFRITQTDEKIQKDNIQGENDATRTHFMVGGKVRQTIKDIGGTLPENLPTEKHIRELKSGKRKLLKEKDKKQAE